MKWPSRPFLDGLSKLPSYDVYSLRGGLRRMGIGLEDPSVLKLSEHKARELDPYMQVFTRPLLNAVYGDAAAHKSNGGAGDLFQLILDPDRDVTRRNLQTIAQTLGIKPVEIPSFLEEYGDFYLSLAYYQLCLDQNRDKTRNLLSVIEKLKSDAFFQSKQDVMRSLNLIEAKVTAGTEDSGKVLKKFREKTAAMWQKISAEQFHGLKKVFGEYQTKVGSTLCALTVKMNAWSQKFGADNTTTNSHYAEFIIRNMADTPRLSPMIHHAGVPSGRF